MKKGTGGGVTDEPNGIFGNSTLPVTRKELLLFTTRFEVVLVKQTLPASFVSE